MILELHRLLDSEDSSIKAISNWISVDSALSAKVLKMANSPYFGGKGQVNSIPQAITLLGLEAVKSIVLASEAKKIDIPDWLDAEAFWQKSISIAGLSRWIARRGSLRQINHEVAFTIGLFSEIGMLVTPDCHGDESAIRAISSAVVRHWRFPGEIVEAIKGGHEEPSPYEGVLDLADRFFADFDGAWETPCPDWIDMVKLRGFEAEGIAALLLANALSGRG